MTTINVDHKGGLVRIGFSGESVAEKFNTEQIWIELTPKEASDIAALLIHNSVNALESDRHKNSGTANPCRTA